MEGLCFKRDSHSIIKAILLDHDSWENGADTGKPCQHSALAYARVGPRQ